MGQIIGGAAKPKRCNLSKLSRLGTPAAGEYILVSSDNSMNAAGQGNFDAYVVGDGKTAATALELKNVESLIGVFDISSYHATGGVLAKYADLTAALDGGNNIPQSFRKGGISVKFVQSSDNTYVQYKYLGTSTAVADFINIDNWQCDDLTIISNSLSQVVTKKVMVDKTGGYIRKYTGQLIENANYRYTDFIPCLPSQQFYCRLRALSDVGVCFYNIRKEYINGINVKAEGATIVSPANAYYVRASSGSLPTVAYIELVSSNKSLQDIPDKSINSIYELFADNSADNIDNYLASTKTVTYRDLYNAVKAIKLYGFDSTKKHTLYILFGGTNNFSFRIAEYSNGAWSVVYQYSLTEFTELQEYSFDHTIGDKRVIATIDFRNAIENYQALFQLSSNPMLIFNKNCYAIERIAGQGINIIDNTISVNEEDLPIILNGEEEYYNISSLDFSYDGYVNPANGVFASHATYKCTGYEPVKAGQIFACHARFYSAAGLAFYNANKQYISGIDKQGADFNFTVPTNAAFVRISNSGSVEPFALLTNPKNMGLVTLTQKFSQYEKPQNIPIRLYPMTKLPCVSFQFDDNPESDDSIVELFESYHKTCAFAFIGSNSNILTHSKRYIDYQNRGFQIMNHCIDGNTLDTTNYTYDTAKEAVLTARGRIESVGMVCNGFVCPSSNIADSFKPILKLAHCYAFTTSAGKNTTINGRAADRCDLHRQTLQGGDTLVQLKSFIDSCIANDQIITFYGHSYELVPDGTVDQFSIAQITALIEYCIEKELAGELYFGGTDDCVKYFFDL